MSSPVQPGAMIADKYRVTGVIGEGGMGVVVAAEHAQLGRKVAIKFLHAAASPTVAERFAREGRIAVQMDSEHVCKVFDVGQLPTGEPYMVMEFLQGQDLSQYVASYGALRTHDAVDYVLQACEGLAQAHVLGVVHRDLKPGNLFMTQRMDASVCIKVLDFGISKLHGGESGGENALTMAGAVLGSPRFISPEQLSGTGNIDLRSDIWALGAVLHELLSGQAAFAADTVGELCFVILNDDPTPLSQVRQDVPPGLAAAVSRCLTKEAASRFQNVAELALALQPFGSGTASVSVQRACSVYTARGWTAPADLVAVSQRAPASGHPQTPQSGYPQQPQSGYPQQQGQQGAQAPAQGQHAAQAVTAQATATAAPAKSSKGPLIGIAAAVILAGAVGGVMLLRSDESASAKSASSSSAASGEASGAAATGSASAAPASVMAVPADPLRPQYDKLAARVKAGDRAAYEPIELLLTKLVSQGVQPGGPRSRFAAHVQILLGDVLALRVTPTPKRMARETVLDALRRPVDDARAAYSKVFLWKQADLYQCAAVKGAALYERGVKILGGLTPPAKPGYSSFKSGKEEYAKAHRVMLSSAKTDYASAMRAPTVKQTCLPAAREGAKRTAALLAKLPPDEDGSAAPTPPTGAAPPPPPTGAPPPPKKKPADCTGARRFSRDAEGNLVPRPECM